MLEMHHPRRRPNARMRWALVAFVVCVGCAGGGGPPTPVIETGPDAKVTADGLYRLKYSGFRNAWVKPDVDFGAYDAIVLETPDVAYKRKPRRSRPSSSSFGNFALTDEQMAAFKSDLLEAFRSEFLKSGFYEVADAPGPKVLSIKPGIIDLIVNVPTDRPIGRDRVWTTSTAVMTLMMELRDSETNEILARIGERREARMPGANGTTNLYWSNVVTDTEAVRSTFARWARILRQQLDRIQEVEGAGDGGGGPEEETEGEPPPSG